MRFALHTGMALIAAAAVHLAAWPLPWSRDPARAEAMHGPIEGYGAATRGGAGRPTCVVTSLADRGPGSLRQCVSTGYRTVIFAVAGTIELTEPLAIEGSFVTVDGFTAPPPGITLRGWGLQIRDQRDIIVRNVRVRDAGPVTPGSSRKSAAADCIGVYGPGAVNLVFDHVSVFNCGDGGIDISSGPKDITIQWSIVSAGKTMLWGSTSSSPAVDTDRISLHHSMLICGPDIVSWGIGCDRMPLVRARGHALRADVRHNLIEGWVRANATKIEARAMVNLVGNAYVPRPDTAFGHRQRAISVGPGSRVHAAANVECGTPPRPDLNTTGNEASPLPAAAVTGRDLGCVVRHAGAHPRDAVDQRLMRYVSRLPDTLRCPPTLDDEQPQEVMP